MGKSFVLAFLLLICSTLNTQAQELDNPEVEWDGLIYFGNKVTWGSSNWKNSGELQVRLRDYSKQLLQWQLEYVGTYLISKHVELVPDFRFTVKTTQYEFRPGFGVVLKHGKGYNQFVHQIKHQVDFRTNGGETTQTLRYFPTYSRILNEHWLLGVTGGIYYKFTEEKNDFELVVAGVNGGYIINKQHAINVTTAFLRQKDFTSGNYLQGFALICRLIININKDYEYLPARYINF